MIRFCILFIVAPELDFVDSYTFPSHIRGLILDYYKSYPLGLDHIIEDFGAVSFTVIVNMSNLNPILSVRAYLDSPFNGVKSDVPAGSACTCKSVGVKGIFLIQLDGES